MYVCSEFKIMRRQKKHFHLISSKNQIIVDGLNKQIAKEKIRVKKTTSIFESFAFLINEVRKSEIKRKLLKYERVLARPNKYAVYFYSAIDLGETKSDIYDLKLQQHKRETVLIKIVESLKDLSKSYDEQKWNKLKELEKNYERLSSKDIYSLMDIEDLLVSSIDEIREIKNIIQKGLKDLRKKRSLILKANSNNLRRDIRQFFRCIVRFIFKNMDDESGDNKLLVTNLKQQFITLKHGCHGKKIYYRTT